MQIVRGAAHLVAADPADVDRAVILGQLAELLIAHKLIGPGIAYKGGAIMHLVDQSPRLSRDLDGAAVAGKAMRRAWVEEALSSAAARRIVLGLPKIVNENASSLVIPVLECRALSRPGPAKITVSLSINWDDPLLEPPALASIQLGRRTARIPVVSARERAAEKARTFLTRGEPRDAYDLQHFGAHVLTATDWQRLPALIKRKLVGHVPEEWDLLARWDAQTELVREPYERGERLVLLTPKPTWAEVLRHLRRFKGCVPQRAALTAKDRRRSRR